MIKSLLTILVLIKKLILSLSRLSRQDETISRLILASRAILARTADTIVLFLDRDIVTRLRFRFSITEIEYRSSHSATKNNAMQHSNANAEGARFESQIRATARRSQNNIAPPVYILNPTYNIRYLTHATSASLLPRPLRPAVF